MSTDNPKIEVRDLRDGEWLWTHKAILFSRFISAADYKVYSGLSSYAGNQDQRSWPSLITLGERLNLSRATVIRSLKLLESCAVISIERRTGFSNMYCLLKVSEVKQPSTPTKEASPHQRLINFFHTTTQTFREIKPSWSAKDTNLLKRALSAGALSETQLAQLMLYFLASWRFKKFSPSMATFFSSGILNGLMNAMQNDRDFWKDLDSYSVRLRGKPTTAPGKISVKSIEELSKALSQKLAVKGVKSDDPQ